MNEPVHLSIIIVWRHPGEPLSNCLRSLAVQTRGRAPRCETIVVTDCPASQWRAMADEFPEVRWVSLPPPLTEPRAWEAGASAARGELVAFAQARCHYAPRWVQAVTAAGLKDNQVAAGPVLPDPQSALAALALYLCDYGAFANPAGLSRPLAASNNVAFRTAALRAASQRHGFDKTALLAAGDFGVTWLPAMRADVKFCQPFLAECVQRFERARQYASWRATTWPAALRYLAAIACVALPALLLARLVQDRYLRSHFAAELVLGSAWIYANLTAWSIGEMCGYVTETRTSARGQAPGPTPVLAMESPSNLL